MSFHLAESTQQVVVVDSREVAEDADGTRQAEKLVDTPGAPVWAATGSSPATDPLPDRDLSTPRVTCRRRFESMPGSERARGGGEWPSWTAEAIWT